LIRNRASSSAGTQSIAVKIEVEVKTEFGVWVVCKKKRATTKTSIKYFLIVSELHHLVKMNDMVMLPQNANMTCIFKGSTAYIYVSLLNYKIYIFYLNTKIHNYTPLYSWIYFLIPTAAKAAVNMDG
jgi:hypothetical protein